MAKADDSDLTDGPVWQALWHVSAPMALGIFGVLAIGLADAYFLARAGATELAAIGFVYPVIVALSAMAIGLSAGANTLISQAKGGGDGQDAITRLVLHAASATLVIAGLVAALFWAVAPVLFAALGAQGQVLENILAYVPFWAASFPFLAVTMICEATFRAHGNGRQAAMTMLFTAVLNIALTPAFIFGIGPLPAFGMAGAGIATLIARALALGLALWLSTAKGYVRRIIKPARGFFGSLRRIGAIGLPAALSRGINPAGMAIVTAAVATVGDAAVAGFGAAARVQSTALIPFLALAAGMAPVIGQAWGQDNCTRAQSAVHVAVLFCLGYGTALGAILLLFAQPFANAMTAAGDAAAYTTSYLRIVGFSLMGYGLLLSVNAALTARSKPKWALITSLTRIGVLYIPLAWLGVSVMGYQGILLATVAANVITIWLVIITAQLNDLWPQSLPGFRTQAMELNRWLRPQDSTEPKRAGTV